MPSLNTAQLPAYLPSATPPPTITRSQAWKELSKVKAHKAPGPDNLPNQVLKRFAFEISEPFCDIMNASLREGVVPVEWKQATVVPVPKVTPTPSMDKLRPVSLTPTLAKVAESFITRWMMADMESSLDHSQFGNRKGRSTNHYLLQLVQYAHQALQDGQSADFLAIDCSKAFDRVNITVALNKLLNMNAHSYSKRYYHGSAASCLVGNNVLRSTGPRQTGMTSHVEYLRVPRLAQLYSWPW